MPDLDRFDRMREAVSGLPGYVTKQSTVNAPATPFAKQETWVVETVHTNDYDVVFVQGMSADGMTRVVLPNSVVEVLYRQRSAIVKQSRKNGARQAAETRKARQHLAEIGAMPEKGNEVYV